MMTTRLLEVSRAVECLQMKINKQTNNQNKILHCSVPRERGRALNAFVVPSTALFGSLAH